jgi:hypothetical protein
MRWLGGSLAKSADGSPPPPLSERLEKSMHVTPEASVKRLLALLVSGSISLNLVTTLFGLSSVAMTTPLSISSVGCQGTPLVNRGNCLFGSERLRMGRGTRLLFLELHRELAGDVYKDTGFDADLCTLLLLDSAGDIRTLPPLLPGWAPTIKLPPLLPGVLDKAECDEEVINAPCTFVRINW